MLVIFLLLFGCQAMATQIERTGILSAPIASGQYTGASNRIVLEREILVETDFPAHPQAHEVISLRKILKEVNADPSGDPLLVGTYHKEGCFEFLSALFYLAGIDFRSALSGAHDVSSLENGDIVKIENSTYYGLPHWGIFLDGLVFHNWDGYRAEFFADFLETYMLPGSAHLILRPSYHLPSASALIYPR